MTRNYLVLTALAVLFAVAACSSDDLDDLGHTWPNLADIQPVPKNGTAAASPEPEAIIQQLRDEAEARKSEGYHSPEPVPPVASDGNNN